MAGGTEGGDSDAFDQNAVAIGTNSSITKEKATTPRWRLPVTPRSSSLRPGGY